MKQILIFWVFFVGLQAKADEGMWAIHNFHHTASDLPISFYSESEPSLKDAVVAVGEGHAGPSYVFIAEEVVVKSEVCASASLFVNEIEDRFPILPTARHLYRRSRYVSRIVVGPFAISMPGDRVGCKLHRECGLHPIVFNIIPV